MMMADKEKVIKELEDIQRHLDTGYSFPICWKSKLILETLKLLKEQEAKPDKCIICEGCGHKLQDDWNWCPWCRLETARGRRVKSDGF